MREMILVEHTIKSAVPTKLDAGLCELSRAAAILVQNRVVQKAIRCRTDFSQMRLHSGATLLQQILILRKSKREESSFLLGLLQKYPLEFEVPAEVGAQLQDCDPGSGQGAEELLLCYWLRALTLSIPVSAYWEKARLPFSFQALQEDGDITLRDCEIDNVSGVPHANGIVEALRGQAVQSLTLESFWENKAVCFPALRFGRDVERHIAVLGTRLFGSLIDKLVCLNQDAAQWQSGAEPIWSLFVRSESKTVQQNEKLAKARQFRGEQGEPQTYYLHCNLGDYRVHFRVEPKTRLVEIGYVGKHLPTALF